MMTGYLGTFVISWSQTDIDGLRSPPLSAVEVGASWSWSGHPVQLDGPGDPLILTSDGDTTLRRHAVAAVRSLVGGALPPVRPMHGQEFADPELDRFFHVTDGRRTYAVTLVDVAEVARPLLMFVGQLPPRGQRLRIVRGLEPEEVVTRFTEAPVGVICFTTGTTLRTPRGPVRVEDLAEGDSLDTKDGGAQEILWIGSRRMSGARLHAMPELRPVRLRAGALGDDEPDDDLVVSPRHRLIVKGRMANELFGTPEVLVAAEDLLNDHSVTRDHAARAVTYVHLMLPRHHVVWANGVETESFHPASTDLQTIDPTELGRLMRIVPGLDRDPRGYGEAVRRELTPSEASILRMELPARH